MASASRVLRRLVALVLVLAGTQAGAAPPPPSGPHPRMFLNGPNLAVATAQAKQAGTSAKAVVDHCQDTINKPGDYTGRGTNYDDEKWPLAAVSCAYAYLATQNS